MNRFHLLLWTSLALLAGTASAQKRVTAHLYVRAEGERVQAAIRVRVAPHWHLYHTDLGPPDAPGMPTVVKMSGEGIEWGEAVFPEPRRYDDPAVGTWSWIHEGRFTIFVPGRAGGEVDLKSVRAHLSGLVCEEGGICLPVDEELLPEGEGNGEIFVGFPGRTEGGPIGAQAAVEGEAPAAPQQGPAEPQEPIDEVDVHLHTRRDGDRVLAVVRFNVAFGWHLFHKELGDPNAIGTPTEIELRGSGIEWGDLVWPEPQRLDDPVLGTWAWVHEGTVLVRAEGRLTGEPAPITARVSGQVCKQMCIRFAVTLADEGPGEEAWFADWPSSGAVAGTDSSAGQASVATGALAAEAGVVEEEGGGSGSLWAFLLASIGAGIFALLMPCTYPMIPITISFFTKQAESRHQSVLPLSLTYGAGIIALFGAIGVAVGVLGAVAGDAIQTFATNPWVNLFFAALFFLFALVLLGVWTLQPPRFLMDAAGRASAKGGYVGVFLMGLTLVVTSFTCTAPFVGTLIAGGIKLGAMKAALGMVVFGLTMAVPFVLLSLAPSKIREIPQAGDWMNVLKVTLGFIELAAALKFVSNADLVWGWGILSREVFLLAWAIIFLVAALFLFGKIQLAGESADEIGPGRLVSALALTMVSAYCFHGYVGHDLDFAMTAIVPPYSTRQAGGLFGGEGGGPAAPREHEIVKDDYEAALSRAEAEQKLLLVNFTGFS